MAYAITNKFAGGTKEQYEAAVATVHPPDGLPEGQTHHYAGPTEDGGWIVVAIWDAKASWEAFRDQTLLPGLKGLGDKGFPGPPETIEFEVDTELAG